MHLPSPQKPRKRSTRLVFLFLVAILPAEALLFFLPGPAGSAQPTTITAQEILTLTNSERANAYLRPLTDNKNLDDAATLKASDMLRYGYFAHTSPQGKDFTQSIKKMNVAYEEAGENLAIDFVSSQAAVQSWMNSENHRRNILNPRYTDSGIAALTGEFNGSVTTIIVQLFIKKPISKN